MPDTGAVYTGTGANFNDGGTTAWTNPTQIEGDVTADAATCSPPANGNTSQRLRCSNFGFSVPSGATIDGVLVEVEQQAANNNRHRWNSVRLLVGGSETGDDKSDASAISTSKVFKSFGGSTDGWNASLDDSDVNNSGFGVSLKIDRNAAQSTTTSLFRARITVFYTTSVEYQDSATVIVALTVTATELAEFADTATVYLDLFASGTDEHIGPKETGPDRVTLTDLEDPSTREDHSIHARCSIANGAHEGYIGFQLYEGTTPIGPELFTSNLTDTATDYELPIAVEDAEDITDYNDLAIEFNGYADTGDSAEFRIHRLRLEVPGSGPIERIDSATVYLDLQSSGTDIGEFVDSQSIYLDLSIDSVEERQQYDADTVYVELTVDSVELAEFTETDTVYLDLQATGSDVAEFVDAATVPLDLSSSGTDIEEAVEDATVYLDLQTTDTQEFHAVDSETVYADLQPASQDAHEAVDAASVYLDITISTDVEEHTTYDTGEVYLDLFASGTDEHTVGSSEYTDSDSVYLDLQVVSAEERVSEDSATVYVELEGSGTDTAQFVDANEVYLDLQGSGTDEFTNEGTDQATVYVDLTLTSSEEAATIEAATVPLALTVTSAQEYAAVDEATVPLALTITATDIAEFVDEAIVPLDLSVISVSLFEGADTQIVLLDLQPSGTDVPEYFDAATVYLDLQPGAIFIQIDFVLEIVGYTLRWRIEAPLVRWDIHPVPVVRWSVLEALARWALLETRRFVWKS